MKNRLEKEKVIFEKMILIYCKNNHKENHPCSQCIDIINYGKNKINNCPFDNSKPFCSKCSIHCYEKNVQKKVKEIMRYSGPRIIFYHPITSLKHLISSIF